MLEILEVNFEQHQDAITKIRQQVFQTEQAIAPELDFDGLDSDAQQLLAYLNAQVVGTVRIRGLGERAKIERLAVLPEFRSRGVGQALIQRAIAWVKQRGYREVILNAQIQTIGFYEQLGFVPWGEEFMEAGILHRCMRQSFESLR